MNIVPLSPITMVRAPGWPLDQSSTLKPDGSLILSSGSLSAEGAIGGVGCGLRLPSWLLAAGLDLSIGLKPGWAASGPAAAIRNAKLPAAIKPRRYDVESDMNASPWCGSSHPFRPGSRPGIATGWSSLARVSDKSPPTRKRLASHAPVDVGRVLLHRRKLGDTGMVRRQMAHRIGRPGVAGQQEGLTTAAAEIDLTALAAGAGLRQKVGAAECIEGRRVRPDIVQ